MGVFFRYIFKTNAWPPSFSGQIKYQDHLGKWKERWLTVEPLTDISPLLFFYHHFCSVFSSPQLLWCLCQWLLRLPLSVDSAGTANCHPGLVRRIWDAWILGRPQFIWITAIIKAEITWSAGGLKSEKSKTKNPLKKKSGSSVRLDRLRSSVCRHQSILHTLIFTKYRLPVLIPGSHWDHSAPSWARHEENLVTILKVNCSGFWKENPGKQE